MQTPEQKVCDHKFVDSKHCLKCGWEPCPECRGLGKVTAEFDAPRFAIECTACGGTGTRNP